MGGRREEWKTSELKSTDFGDFTHNNKTNLAMATVMAKNNTIIQ